MQIISILNNILPLLLMILLYLLVYQVFNYCILFGTNTTYLSNTVNRRFGVNLKTLVNRYRVNHAKRLMEVWDSAFDIGELIRASGFSSRSIFYSAFRREVGMTPTRYWSRLERKTNES